MSDFIDDYRKLLGWMPEKCDLNPRVIEQIQKDGYVREKVVIAVEEGEDVPAYLLIPDEVKKPSPAVVCIHQHAGMFGIGKSEAAGRIGYPHGQYALRYCKAGFVTFAADQRAFEERKTIKDWSGDRMAVEELILKGRTMAGAFAFEAGRAIDYLQTREEVDGDKIGITGHSMGAMASLVTLPVERRIKAAVISCGVSTYEGKISRGETMPGAFLIPGIMQKYDLPDVFAAARPTPLLLCAGKKDGTFKFQDFEKAEPVIRKAYEKSGFPERFETLVEDVAHKYTDTMYEKGAAWFRRWLG